MAGLCVVEAFLEGASLERLRGAMRGAGGAAAPVSAVASARRTTELVVPDGLRAEVERALEDRRAELAGRFDRELDEVERAQFLRYAPGDYFVAHQDGNTPMVPDHTLHRRVSAVLFVSDPGDYDGGALVLHGDERVALSPPAGTLVAFPAETTHEVTPLERGERLTVVAWYRAEPDS